MSIIIPKEVRKKVASIFEHPNNVYSIYLKDDTEDVVWVEGKVELYEYLRSLGENRTNSVSP